MGLIANIIRMTQQRGIGNTLAVIWSQIAEIAFDLKHGTDTVFWRQLPDLNIPGPNKDRGNVYQATVSVAVRRIFADIRPLLPDNAVCLDIGSGKGRVLLLAPEFRFKAVRGVEFSPELCAIARRNVERYFRSHAVKPVVDIVGMDAADYRIQPDECLFFLFNPFDGVVLEKVMQNITRSLAEHHRTAFIVYNNPDHRDVIEKCPEFALKNEYEIRGNVFSVFVHEPSQLNS